MWLARCPLGELVSWACGLGSVVFESTQAQEACTYVAERPSLSPPSVRWARLSLLQCLPGAAFGRAVTCHYVVATDVLPEMDAELNRWYETEHLPGLAAVPGTVRATRYECLGDEGPRYYAAYDLADESTFNSAPWLAVRGTPWSSRVRPAFIHTRRTMYRKVFV